MKTSNPVGQAILPAAGLPAGSPNLHNS